MGTRSTIPAARRRHVMHLIERVGLLDQPIDEQTRLVYVLSALVCDDEGRVTWQAVEQAITDRHLVALAENMIALSRLSAEGLA